MAREICNNADVDDRIMAGNLDDAVLQRLYRAFDTVINKIIMVCQKDLLVLKRVI